jgi:hypothetical protein
MPEEPAKSDLEAIREYVERGGQRKQALGRSSPLCVSLPIKVLNEMERLADREGENPSTVVFNALVEKILIRQLWEEEHADPGPDADRARSRTRPRNAKRRNRKAGAGGD